MIKLFPLFALLLLCVAARADDPTLPEPSPSLGTPTNGEGAAAPMTTATNPETQSKEQEVKTQEALPAVTPAPSTAKGDADIPQSELSDRELLKDRLNKEQESRDKSSLDHRRELVKHEAATNHVELDYVMNAFANYDFNSANKGSPIFRTSKGGSLEWLFFPITHGFGRFGIGPAFGVYEAKSDAVISGLSADFYTAGIKATYQLQLFVNQVFVPFAVAGVDYVKLASYYSNFNVAAGSPSVNVSGVSFNTPYYGFGLGLNLNPLEYKAAKESLAEGGVRKYFIVYTFVRRVNSDPSRAGDNHFLGLRFEY